MLVLLSVVKGLEFDGIGVRICERVPVCLISSLSPHCFSSLSASKLVCATLLAASRLLSALFV